MVNMSHPPIIHAFVNCVRASEIEVSSNLLNKSNLSVSIDGKYNSRQTKVYLSVVHSGKIIGELTLAFQRVQ